MMEITQQKNYELEAKRRILSDKLDMLRMQDPEHAILLKHLFDIKEELRGMSIDIDYIRRK